MVTACRTTATVDSRRISWIKEYSGFWHLADSFELNYRGAGKPQNPPSSCSVTSACGQPSRVAPPAVRRGSSQEIVVANTIAGDGT
jgi:hypothetical protein